MLDFVKAQAEDTQAPPPSGGGRKPMSPSDRARHASLVRWGKEQPFAARLAAVRERRKKAKGGKAKKPKATPEQIAAEKEAKLEANRQKVYGEVGLMEDAAASLTDLAKGTPTDDDGGLVKLGLAEQAGDGSYRLTPAGRQVFNAASRGDLGAARDTLSRAKDKQGEKDKAAAEEGKEAAASGGGGGGSKKPSEEEKKKQKEQEKEKATAANRESVKQEMAQSDQGLAPAGFDNLMKLSEGAEPDKVGAEGLISMGVAERGSDGTLRLTPAGRQAVNAANRGDAKQAIDAISRGADRVGQAKERDTERATQEKERDAATAARDQERTAREAERERVRTARKERVQNVALRRLDRTGKLSDRQAADLEEAGLVEFDDKGEPRLTEEGRKRLRKPPEEKKAWEVKHGSHDQSTHGRSGRRGGGGRSSTGGGTTDTTLRSAGLITDKKMTQDERTSLQWYQGVGHDRINAELRGGAPVRDQYTLDRTTGNIDSIMARSTLNRDIEVHRGMFLETPHAQVQVAQWQPGAIVRDLGYVSTSANQDVAQRFGNDVTVRIRAPKGTPAIYMPTAQPLRMTSQGAHNEYEVLLGRGLNYRVTGREEKDGKLTVDMEVVP